MSRVKYISFRDAKIETPNEKIGTIGKTKYLRWGDDDNFPNFITYLYVNSPTNSGIINGKVNYMFGDGLNAQIENGQYSINEVLQNALRDFETHNGFAIKVINSDGRKTYEPIAFANCRLTESGDQIVYFDDIRKKKFFDVLPNYFDYPNSDASIALFLDNGTQFVDDEGNKVVTNYPLPTYYGALKSIMTEIEGTHFHFSEIVNGFLSGTMISFNNGYPKSETIRREMESNIKRQATARTKRGGIVITYSDGKDRQPTIQPLNGNNMNERYLNVITSMRDAILISHSVTSPMLFGIKTQGQLGGVTELAIAYDIFKENYIEPRRKMVEEFFSEVLGQTVTIIDKRPSFLQPKQPSQQQFEFDEDEDPVFKELAKRGTTLDKINLIAEFEVTDKPIDEITLQKQLNFSPVLTKTQLDILQLLRTGETISNVIQILGLSAEDLMRNITYLKELKYLNDDLKVTFKGKLASKRATTYLKTVYQYKVRPGVGAPVIKTTRDFCRRLINLNKVYTRAEIDVITRIVGRDVWLYRGGFYHDPKQDKTFPYCRHTWYQMIIEEKI